MLSRLGALLQEAVGAVRPGTLGRAGPGPEGRAWGRGRSRPARGRTEGAGRLQEGTPNPGRGAPSRASSLPRRAPPAQRSPLPGASFRIARVPSSSPGRSGPLTLLPGLLPVYFSCSPSLSLSQTPLCRMIPSHPIVSSQNSPQGPSPSLGAFLLPHAPPFLVTRP